MKALWSIAWVVPLSLGSGCERKPSAARGAEVSASSAIPPIRGSSTVPPVSLGLTLKPAASALGAFVAPRQHGPSAVLRKDGVTLAFDGVPLGADCKPGKAPTAVRGADDNLDWGRVKVCARALRTDNPAAGIRIVLAAEPEVPYSELVLLIDAVRNDATESLFPEFELWRPIGGPTWKVPLPRFESSVEAARAEEVIVRVAPQQITIGEEGKVVATYEDLRALPNHGIDGKYPTVDHDDLRIAPLEKALEAERALAITRSKRRKEEASPVLIVVADQATPYRLLAQVLVSARSVGLANAMLLLRTGS